MALEVSRIKYNGRLDALHSSWNRLAASHPLRSWEWLESWWQQFENELSELYVLTARDPDGTLIGLAPWYLETHVTSGRTVRFLGSGDVCTDHLTILAPEERRDEVARAIANWLLDRSHNRQHADDRWDLIELDGVAADDTAIDTLVKHLAAGGCSSHGRKLDSLWRLTLPKTWDDYVARFSKQRRKRLRRLARQLDQDEFTFWIAGTRDELDQAFEVLIDLHQKRRQSVGEPGCFGSTRFSVFARQAAQRLWEQGRLRLCVLEHDSRPVSVEFGLADDTTHFLYQSGIEPTALEMGPGHLSTIKLIRSAIDESYDCIDFLRGDEPYKATWGAQPTPLAQYRIAANHPRAQLRQSIWVAGNTVKGWIKSGMGIEAEN